MNLIYYTYPLRFGNVQDIEIRRESTLFLHSVDKNLYELIKQIRIISDGKTLVDSDFSFFVTWLNTFYPANINTMHSVQIPDIDFDIRGEIHITGNEDSQIQAYYSYEN